MIYFYWKYFSISVKMNILATQIEDFEVGDQLLEICNLDREGGPIVLFLFINGFEVNLIVIELLMVLLTFINLTQLLLLENKIVL